MPVLEDRISANPNRFLLKDEATGESRYVHLELADNPIQEGNKVNKQNIIDTVVSYMPKNAFSTVSTFLSSGTYIPMKSGKYLVFVIGQGGNGATDYVSDPAGGGGGGVAIGEVNLNDNTSYPVIIGSTCSFFGISATKGEDGYSPGDHWGRREGTTLQGAGGTASGGNIGNWAGTDGTASQGGQINATAMRWLIYYLNGQQVSAGYTQTNRQDDTIANGAGKGGIGFYTPYLLQNSQVLSIGGLTSARTYFNGTGAHLVYNNTDYYAFYRMENGVNRAASIAGNGGNFLNISGINYISSSTNDYQLLGAGNGGAGLGAGGGSGYGIYLSGYETYQGAAGGTGGAGAVFILGGITE